MSDADEIGRGSHTYRLGTETVMGLHTQLRRAGDEKTRAIELRLIQRDGSSLSFELAEEGSSAHLTRTVANPVAAEDPPR